MCFKFLAWDILWGDVVDINIASQTFNIYTSLDVLFFPFLLPFFTHRSFAC